MTGTAERYIDEEEPKDSGGGIDALGMLMSLLRGKRTMLACGLLVAGCAAAVSFAVRPQFTATVEILPPQTTPETSVSALTARATASAALGPLGGIASSVQAKAVADMYAVMIAATPVEDALVEEFDLESLYHARNRSEARRALAGHTVITSLKEGLITVSVRDHDPHLAASLANGYVVQLRHLMKRLALNGASQRRAFYEEQLAQSRTTLADSEARFKQMQQSSHLISVEAQTKTLIEGAANLRAQIAIKQVQLQGLLAYSTEANPQVQIAGKEIEALQAQQAKIGEQDGESYTNGGLSSVPEAELNFVQATRELRYEEELYDFLLKQYEGARIDEAEDAPVVQVIEPALVPEEPSSPSRPLIVLGAMFAGMLLGAILVLYRDWRSGMKAQQSQQLNAIRSAAFRWDV